MRHALLYVRRGVIAWIAVVALIPAVMLTAASINGGQQTNDRRNAQDAADALAHMHSVWTARSMNYISMNNVEAAQLLTVAIGSEALDEALTWFRAQAYTALLVVYAHSAVCPAFAPRLWRVIRCFRLHFGRYSRPARRALSETSRIRRTFDPDHGIRVARDGLSAIDRMNREIVERFPTAIADIGDDIRSGYQVDHAHFVDPCQGSGQCPDRSHKPVGMSLPLTSGGSAARLELCAGMQFGTLGSGTTYVRKGFPFGRGPLSAGGGRSNPIVKWHINQVTGIGRELQRFYDYYRRLRMMAPGPDHPFPQLANLRPPQRANGSNLFTRTFDTKFASLCAGYSGPFGLRVPVPELWRPIGHSLAALPRVSGPNDMPQAYHIFAAVQDADTRRIGTQVFGNQGFGHFAYGQTGVYNPEGISLFSQNWRASFMLASRTEAPAVLAADLRRDAPAAFGKLIEVLKATASTADGGRLNAH